MRPTAVGPRAGPDLLVGSPLDSAPQQDALTAGATPRREREDLKRAQHGRIRTSTSGQLADMLSKVLTSHNIAVSAVSARSLSHVGQGAAYMRHRETVYRPGGLTRIGWAKTRARSASEVIPLAAAT